jgi:inner membrane protein
MTWKSHSAIATAITLPFNVMGIVPATIGATAPDWIEYILNFLGFRVEHRRETHYLIVPLFIIILSFFIDYKNFIFWFGIGYLSHWFADGLTVSGVPVAPNSRHKIHFFGGSIRTGEPKEYVISFSFLLVSFLIFNSNILNYKQNENFNVYKMDYKQLYEKKIIDEKEYKENRFKFF